MQLLSNIQLHNGSLIDEVTKVKGSNNGCSFADGYKGMQLDLDPTDEVNGYGIKTGVKTIAFVIRPTADTTFFFDHASGTASLYTAANTITGAGLTQCYINKGQGEVDTDTLSLNQWQIVIAEFSAGINFATNFEIVASSLLSLAGEIWLYDSLLSVNQKNKLYEKFQFANAYWKHSYNKTGSSYPKPEYDNDPTVLAHYTFNPIDGKVLNIRGTGLYNGTINGAIKTKDGMYIHSRKKISFTSYNTATSFSVFSRLKLIKTGTSGYIRIISNGQYIMIRNDLTRLYCRTADGTALTFTITGLLALDKWFDFEIIKNISSHKLYINAVYVAEEIDATSNYLTINAIGDSSNDYGEFEIEDLIIDNSVRILAEIKAYHNSFIHPVFIENFSNNGADGIIKLPKGWNPSGTGAGKIGELSLFVNSSLNIGNPYFQFTTAGTIIKHINLDEFPNNGYISYWYMPVGTGTWEERTGLINAPVTGVAYANQRLTFTGASIGDRITNINLLNGVKQ